MLCGYVCLAQELSAATWRPSLQLEGSRAIATADWKLSDDEIAALLTYIRNAWGNAATGAQPGDVGNMRVALHREAQRSP
jgi:mono/diheme cytochrome c family protein